jgi:hypothetical protein
MRKSMRCFHDEVPLTKWPLHYKKLDAAMEAAV